MKQRACAHSVPPCRSCIARRNRKRGLDKQRLVFDILEIPVKFRGQRSNEEQWGESPHLPGFRWEVKSGKMPALIRGALDQVGGAIGSRWEGAVAVVPEGSEEPYAVIRLRALVEHWRSAAEVGQLSRQKALWRDVEKIARAGREAL